MNATLEQVKESAKKFLEIADKLNVKVSSYIDGSNDKEAEEAYWTVREADKRFIDTVNSYCGYCYEYGLNYELAEEFI